MPNKTCVGAIKFYLRALRTAGLTCLSRCDFCFQLLQYKVTRSARVKVNFAVSVREGEDASVASCGTQSNEEHGAAWLLPVRIGQFATANSRVRLARIFH